MEQTEWKAVIGYEGFYEVSNQGEVRSCSRMIKRSRGGLQSHRGQTIKPQTAKSGYVAVVLSREGKIKTFTVHLLVARAFLGDPAGRVVDHIDRDKANNRLSNLRYITQRENVVHAKTPTAILPTGVTLNPPIYKKRYRARITMDGKLRDLGSFHTKEEAQAAYYNQFTQLIK